MLQTHHYLLHRANMDNIYILALFPIRQYCGQFACIIGIGELCQHFYLLCYAGIAGNTSLLCSQLCSAMWPLCINQPSIPVVQLLCSEHIYDLLSSVIECKHANLPQQMAFYCPILSHCHGVSIVSIPWLRYTHYSVFSYSRTLPLPWLSCFSGVRIFVVNIFSRLPWSTKISSG